MMSKKGVFFEGNPNSTSFPLSLHSLTLHLLFSLSMILILCAWSEDNVKFKYKGNFSLYFFLSFVKKKKKDMNFLSF